MIQATLTSKGQITIPKVIRDRFNWHAGDHLKFLINSNGELSLTTKNLALNEIFGMFNYKCKKKITTKNIKEAIKMRMIRKYK